MPAQTDDIVRRPVLEPGRVCLKLAGREGGKYCVVLETASPFVLITGPKAVTCIKRRKCNITHLEPTKHRLDISGGSDDAAIGAAWKASGLIEELGIQVPIKRSLHRTEKKKS